MKQFTQHAADDKKVSKVASATNLTELVIPHGLDYRNFTAEAAADTPGEGSIVAASKKARYWIVPMPAWGLYAYFSLPHPFKCGRNTRLLSITSLKS